MRALVTGGTGFIGGALAQALLAQGWDVQMLVRPGSLRKRRADTLCEGQRSCQVVSEDLDRPGDLKRVVAGIDVIYHAAAIRDRWGTPLASYWKTNVDGTSCLLDASIGIVKRFVYISSVGVLGYPGVLGIDERFPSDVGARKAGYHGSKAAAERVVLHRAKELETVIIRPTITYGIGDTDGMVTRLIHMIAQRRFVRIGGGRNHLHLTHIDDLVRGLLLAGTHPAAPGETFILAGPRSTTSGELIAKIERRLGRRPARTYVPERPARAVALLVEALYRARAKRSSLPGTQPPPISRDKIDTLCIHRGFSFEKAAHCLGYRPQVELPEGLDQVIPWALGENGGIHV